MGITMGGRPSGGTIRSRRGTQPSSSSSSHPAAADALPGPASDAGAEQLPLLAASYGVHMHHLRLGSSPCTQLGLFWKQEAHVTAPALPPPPQPQSPPSNALDAATTASEAPSETLVLSVPLHLVLSTDLPESCCPATASVRRTIPSHLPWEIQLGALLLWASTDPQASLTAGGFQPSQTTSSLPTDLTSHLQQESTARFVMTAPPTDIHQPPPEGSFAGFSSLSVAQLRGFWCRYSHAYIPAARGQTSLLHFSTHELKELQDTTLMATALAWQAEAHAAHRLLTHGPTPFSKACGGPRSLDAFLAAVGAVESRAFGVKVGGEQLHAMVPFFDLANHSCTSTARHCLGHGISDLRQPPSISGSGNGNPLNSMNPSRCSPAPHQPPPHSTKGQHSTDSVAAVFSSIDMYAQLPCSRDGGQQFFISYGEKSNRKLMEQYGFVVPGNQYDRLEDLLSSPPPRCKGRLRRDRISAAAAALVERLQSGSQATRKSGASVDGEWGDLGEDSMAEEGEAGRHAAVQCARVRAAAAGIVKTYGWRNLHEFKSITAASELQVLHRLEHVVAAELAAMPTLAQDLGLLAACSEQTPHAEATGQPLSASAVGHGTGSEDGVGQRRLAAAVAYRAERKRCLATVLELLQEAQTCL